MSRGGRVWHPDIKGSGLTDVQPWSIVTVTGVGAPGHGASFRMVSDVSRTRQTRHAVVHRIALDSMLPLDRSRSNVV